MLLIYNTPRLLRKISIIAIGTNHRRATRYTFPGAFTDEEFRHNKRQAKQEDAEQVDNEKPPPFISLFQEIIYSCDYTNVFYPRLIVIRLNGELALTSTTDRT